MYLKADVSSEVKSSLLYLQYKLNVNGNTLTVYTEIKIPDLLRILYSSMDEGWDTISVKRK